MAGVLLPDQLQQPQLHRLLGGPPLPQGPAEKVPEGIRPLAALEILLPGGPGDGGWVEPQPLRQGHHGHGGQLRGLAGEEGVLGLQNGLGALAEGAAPALQAVQQPLGLLHLLLEIGPGLRLVGLLQQPDVILADGHPGQVVVVQDHLELSVQLRDEQVRPDILGGFRRLEGPARAGVQGGDPLLRRTDLLHGGVELPGDEAVVLLSQIRQEPPDDLHVQRGGILLTGQLQQQALGEGPGAHTGGVQALQCLQGLLDQRLGDLQIRHAVQILLAETALLVHQLRQIPAQGQQGLWHAPALQLVAEEGGEALRLPVRDAPLRHGAGAVLRQSAVDPVDLLPQRLVGLVELRQVRLLHQRVLLADLVQVLQQLLRVHLQKLHGLQQLGRQLQLLPQLCAEMNETHPSPPPLTTGPSRIWPPSGPRWPGRCPGPWPPPRWCRTADRTPG